MGLERFAMRSLELLSGGVASLGIVFLPRKFIDFLLGGSLFPLIHELHELLALWQLKPDFEAAKGRVDFLSDLVQVYGDAFIDLLSKLIVLLEGILILRLTARLGPLFDFVDPQALGDLSHYIFLPPIQTAPDLMLQLAFLVVQVESKILEMLFGGQNHLGERLLVDAPGVILQEVEVVEFILEKLLVNFQFVRPGLGGHLGLEESEGVGVRVSFHQAIDLEVFGVSRRELIYWGFFI